MYHLFETEMKAISEFNSESLRWFSIGSFFLSCLIAIVVDYAFAGSTITDFGKVCLHWGVPCFGILSLVTYAYGFWVLYQKKTLIDQIKYETKTESGSPTR